MLFSAMLGTGWQLLLLVFAVIVYAMAGKIAVFHKKQPGLLHVSFDSFIIGDTNFHFFLFFFI